METHLFKPLLAPLGSCGGAGRKAGGDRLRKPHLFHLRLQFVLVALGLPMHRAPVTCNLHDESTGIEQVDAKNGARLPVNFFCQLGMGAALPDRVAIS